MTPVESLQEFKERTARKLGDVRCPDHRQPPRLTFRGASLRDVSIQVSACCDKLSALANDRLAGINRDAVRLPDPPASPRERESEQPSLPPAA